jgi:hypothetical protein
MSEFQSKVEAIAKAMGGTWALVPSDVNPNGCAHVTDGTTELSLYLYGGSSKIEVHATYVHNEHRTSAPPVPKINVGKDRAPEAIAKDILRRLVPDAAAWQQGRRDVIAKLDAARDARDAEASTIAALLGTTYDPERNRRNGNDARVGWFGAPHGTYGSFTPSHDGTSVSIDLSGVPAHVAERIVVLLAKWAKGEREND